MLMLKLTLVPGRRRHGAGFLPIYEEFDSLSFCFALFTTWGQRSSTTHYIFLSLRLVYVDY